MQIIKEYDKNFRSMSLDEVYFDITSVVDAQISSSKLSSPSEECDRSRSEVAQSVVQTIRSRVREVTGGLTCSAGIANNFMLAKICADMKKPDGQFALAPTLGDISKFLASLPCRKIPGIGKVLQKVLAALGLSTMGDVLSNLHRLHFVCTPSTREFLMRASVGIGEEDGEEDIDGARNVPAGAVIRKSLSVSRTFTPMSESVDIKAKLREICGMVEEDMRKEDLYGQVVTLRLKTSAFEPLTRCVTSPNYLQSASDIYRLVCSLLEPLLPIKVRLLGVSLSRFKNAFDPSTASTNSQSTLSQYLSLTPKKMNPSDVVRPSAFGNSFPSLLDNFTSSSSSPSCLNSSYSTSAAAAFSPTIKSISSSLAPSPSVIKRLCSQTKVERGDCSAIVDMTTDDTERHETKRNKSADSNYHCPVCQIQLASTSLIDVNRHLDKCLKSPARGHSSLISRNNAASKSDSHVQKSKIYNFIQKKV